MTTLTKENAKLDQLIVCKDHPEWGNWRMWQDRNGWVITAYPQGSRMLDEGEFKFWRLKE